MNHKCESCGESHKITYWEWQGVGDRTMAIQCQKCWKMTHHSGKVVKDYHQDKEYGPVTFEMEDGSVYINLNPKK